MISICLDQHGLKEVGFFIAYSFQVNLIGIACGEHCCVPIAGWAARPYKLHMHDFGSQQLKYILAG